MRHLCLVIPAILLNDETPPGTDPLRGGGYGEAMAPGSVRYRALAGLVLG